jgi:hypothetical protein
MDPPYPCPCCGYLVFHGPPGSYEICPICFWEDDAVELELATTRVGGANGISLREAQANFASFGACDERCIPSCRPPGDTPRDPAWRPIDPARDRFEAMDAPDRRHAPAVSEVLYYWRPTYWLRTGSAVPSTRSR